MAKSFDSKQAKITLDNATKSLDEKTEKLNEFNEAKQDLFEMRKTIDGLDMDEDVKNNIIELLNSTYENLQEQAKQEANALDALAKETDATKLEIMDAEVDTAKAVESISSKSNILEKMGLNILDEAKSEAELSLQELQELKEESIKDIDEIMKLAHELNSI